MSQVPAVALETVDESAAGADAAVVLKGTARGLEILISGTPTASAIADRLTALLAEAPKFFAGCNARVVIDGVLPLGALAALEAVAMQFELRILEVGPAPKRARPVDVDDGWGNPDPSSLADGSGRVTEEVLDDPIVIEGVVEPIDVTALAESLRIESLAELEAELPVVPGPRLVCGPVRSGVIVDHPGHVIVVGDVNPGAEVRAEGSIIVLGRLRGVAHAGIHKDAGFIVALSLQPQQLRIGRMVARAGDSDSPSDGAEIAYVTSDIIVVERFLGRLPSGLAASM